MNKLFDSFTWKINETGLAEQRSKEHISKYGNGIATMHEPTIKAILRYATVNKSYGCIAVGTSDSNVIRNDKAFHGKQLQKRLADTLQTCEKCR